MLTLLRPPTLFNFAVHSLWRHTDKCVVVAYAAEEISEAKDGFVRYFSDEEGMEINSIRQERCQHFSTLNLTNNPCSTGNFYLSYVDPVVIGRRAFHSTNDFICGVVGSFRDTLCAVVDSILDTIADVNKGIFSAF